MPLSELLNGRSFTFKTVRKLFEGEATLMPEIQIHSETFNVYRYRRNYKRCRACRKRTGTLLYSTELIPVTFTRHPIDYETPAIEHPTLGVASYEVACY